MADMLNTAFANDLAQDATCSGKGTLELPKQATVAAQGLNVLLVEDDDADAYLVESALCSNAQVGRVLRARDGVEALAIIDDHKFRPDVAIVDLRMPRKDGFALLLELRARVTVDFPSVVLTSSRCGADVYRSEKRGATAFITKPNSLEKLTTVLGKVVATIERPL